MSKFKIERGDYVCIRGLSRDQIAEIVLAFTAAGGVSRGDIHPEQPYLMFDYRDGEIWTVGSQNSLGMKRQINGSDVLEDHTAWHPHHDVIVAWAKGAKVEFYDRDSGGWYESPGLTPCFSANMKYRIKPEPDHTAEIAEIERKMRELADRLGEPKGEAK